MIMCLISTPDVVFFSRFFIDISTDLLTLSSHVSSKCVNVFHNRSIINDILCILSIALIYKLMIINWMHFFFIKYYVVGDDGDDWVVYLLYSEWFKLYLCCDICVFDILNWTILLNIHLVRLSYYLKVCHEFINIFQLIDKLLGYIHLTNWLYVHIHG